MPTYRYEWSAFLTPAVIAAITERAGADASDAEVKASLIRVLERSSGIPIFERVLGDGEKTDLGSRAIEAAMRKYLMTARRRGTHRAGLVPAPSPNDLCDARLERIERVQINSATVGTIDALPGMRSDVAAAIVTARTAGGSFRGLDDVAARVSGFGEASVSRFRHAFAFDRPDTRHAPAAVASDFGEVIAQFLALHTADDALTALRLAMSRLATLVTDDPHPSYVQRRPMRDVVSIPATGMSTGWCGMLFGSDYYRELAVLFDRAGSRVDVCMFHIALPSPGHPTKALLDALVDGKSRGVMVRVLVDQDRPEDPYRSTVINAAAKSYLASSGIACRSDAADVLLHSKFVLIDDDLAVVGSHNWSAGSYFQFDDISMVVASPPLVTQMRSRFEQLWTAAEG